MGRDKPTYRCKTGSVGNPDGNRRYYNMFKGKCQSSQKAARRRYCSPGTFRSQKSGRCKRTKHRKGVHMYK